MANNDTNYDTNYDPAQMIGFEGEQEDFEDAPDEAKDHMLAAFAHAAGLGPHPGKKSHMITFREGDDHQDHSVPTDSDRQRAVEEPL
jgi:hypothetical protein